MEEGDGDMEENGAGEETGGSGAGALIAFIGLLILVGGLIAYLYSEEYQIGFFTSVVYPHRDLGTVLIPTGVAIMSAGIVLYTVRKRSPTLGEGTTFMTHDTFSSPPPVEEKTKSIVPEIGILKSSQSEIEARIENIKQEISTIQHMLSEAKAAVDRGELSVEAFGELEANKLREIDRLKQQRAQEEASLFELGMEIKKKRSEMEEVFSKLDEEWDQFLCSSCFGSGIKVDREYYVNYIILLSDSSRKCAICDGSRHTDLWIMLTEDEIKAVEAGRDKVVRERTEWYNSELEKLRENVPISLRRKIQQTLQTLSDISRATATGDEKLLVT
jgi:hypothetical protein